MSDQRNIFALCDTEFEYACRFMEYLNQNRGIPFEVHAFTSTEEFIHFARENKVEILLISEKAMVSEIKYLPINQIMILSEGAESLEFCEFPNVYKYQASDLVIREVFSCYGQNLADSGSGPRPGKTKLKTLGIFSADNQSWKKLFALTLAQVLAKERNVLYLDLEAFSILPHLLDRECEGGLSEILYLARQEKKALTVRLKSMVQKIQAIDYLPPVQRQEDLQQAGEKDWLWLIRSLTTESDYDFLILDLGAGIGDMGQLLRLCDRIYIPLAEHPLEQAKYLRFLKLLGWEKDEVENMFCPVLFSETKQETFSLPKQVFGKSGPGNLEGLIWGSGGDFVRQLIREEKIL